MTVLFPALVLISALLCWPALRLSRHRGPESRWILLLAGPAVVVWVVLTASGYGAQSLSNLVEVLWLFGAGVLLAYLKVFLFDRFSPVPRWSTYILMVLLAVAAVALRSFMPVLPE